MREIWAVTKRNLASSLIPVIITLAVVFLATTSSDSQIAISRGNYTWLYLIMLPFFVVFGNYKKLINLNASKKAYYFGSMLTYTISAFFVSAVNMVIHLAIDPLNQRQVVINLIDLCGWGQNGMIAAFLQQFLFLLVSAIFLHVLLSVQPYWYGWVVDGVVIAVISIFIPVAPLRAILVSFFGVIMFNEVAWLHILVCAAAGMILAWLGLVAIKRKSM